MKTEYLGKVGNFIKWLALFILAVFLLFGCSPSNSTTDVQPQETAQTAAEAIASTEAAATIETAEQPDISGSYSSKEDVALYIHTYGKLPDNFITKNQAEKAGWVSKKANLWEVAPGKSIGGSHFGNYEEQLPDEDGRKWYECDIDFDGGYRGAKRIIYSSDGLIYYTGDHYKSFEQLY